MAHFKQKEPAFKLPYLSQPISENVPKNMKTGCCANKTTDVILSRYRNIAQKSGIDFLTDIRLPEEVNIPEPKLCVLFGNLLENAVDACRAARADKPYIKICSTIVGNAFSLTVDHTCGNPPYLSKRQNYVHQA